MGWQLGLGIHHIEAGVLHELVVVTGQELVVRATCQQAALPAKAASRGHTDQMAWVKEK